MKPIVVAFAKDPAPGCVKTRLGATIGLELAAELYAGMVTDLLLHLMHDGTPWDLEIHLDRPSGFYEQFHRPIALQRGNDLGEKLYSCLSSGLARGADSVTVIGSDTPALRAEWLDGLMAEPGDVVLGPTDDGGFWGILARSTHPEMFRGVRWSTGDTRRDTMDAATRAGLSVALGPPGWDVDDREDLLRLIEAGCAGPATSAILRKLGQGSAGLG